MSDHLPTRVITIEEILSWLESNKMRGQVMYSKDDIATDRNLITTYLSDLLREAKLKMSRQRTECQNVALSGK